MENGKDVKEVFKVGYSELVELLSKRINESEYKTNLFTKEYSKLLQNSLKQGKDIKVLGICDIYFNYKSKDKIVDNDVLGYREQIDELVKSLGWSELLVSRMLKEYLRLMKQKLEQGYKVNIKSILYIEPSKDGTGYDTRCNPNIEYPENMFYMVLNDVGNKSLVEINNKKLSIRIDLSEELKAPKKLEDKVVLERIDI